MSKVIEKNIAELIIVSLFLIVLLSSCGSSKQYHVGTGEIMAKRCGK